MSMMVSETAGVSIVYSIVCSGVDQGKHQRSASLAFVRGIKGPVTRKMLPLDDVIMCEVLAQYKFSYYDYNSYTIHKQASRTHYCWLMWIHYSIYKHYYQHAILLSYSLGPSDVIWRHGSKSKLRFSSESYFPGNVQDLLIFIWFGKWPI